MDGEDRIVLGGWSSSGNGVGFAAARLTPAGALDATFANEGVFELDRGDDGEELRSVAQDHNGMLVFGGNNNAHRLVAVRLNQAGGLDKAFAGGIAAVDSSGYPASGCVAVTADNSVILGSHISSGDQSRDEVRRYNFQGIPDSTFGDHGVALVPATTPLNFMTSLAMDSNGRIVTAGFQGGYNTSSIVSRLLANGQADNSFNATGERSSFFAGTDHAYAMALQSDGKIVLAGTTDTIESTDFALTRLTSSGSQDSTFGNQGQVITNFGTGTNQARAVCVDSSNRIWVAGVHNDAVVTPVGASGSCVVARFTPSGALDTSFGTGGKVIFAEDPQPGPGVLSMVLDGDSAYLSTAKYGTGLGKAVVMKLRSDGSLDPSFGSGGKVEFGQGDSRGVSLAVGANHKIYASCTQGTGSGIFRLTTSGQLDTALGSGGSTATLPITAGVISLSKSGRIAITGGNQFNFDDKANVQVLLTSGQPDPSFAGGNVLTLDLAGSPSRATAVTFDAKDRVLVAGISSSSSALADFAVARVLPTGTLDSTFGTGGIQRTDFFGGEDIASAIALSSQGRIYVAGTASLATDASRDFAVASYLAGNVPTGFEIDSFAPVAAPIGDPLDIYGTGFTSASKITIGATNKEQAFTVVSDGQIHIDHLATGTESGRIHVIKPGAETTSATSFHLLPKITSFTPDAGGWGTSVTVTGTGFKLTTGDNVSALYFTGDGKDIPATGLKIVSKTQLTCIVPPNALTGILHVANNFGDTASEQPFTIVPATLKVTGLTPRSAKVGDTVTLTGTGFNSVNSVSFKSKSGGDIAADFLVVSGKELHVFVPGGTVSCRITVKNRINQTAQSPVFVVIPDPVSFTPVSGAPGTVVTITGKSFQGVTGINFNGIASGARQPDGIVPATGWSYQNPTTILVRVPTGATTGKINLKYPMGIVAGPDVPNAFAPTASDFTVTAPGLPNPSQHTG